MGGCDGIGKGDCGTVVDASPEVESFRSGFRRTGARLAEPLLVIGWTAGTGSGR